MTQLSTSAELTAASPEERLAALGITLPPAPQPIANFVTHVVEGNMLYLSGQGTREADGHMRTGKVGAEISTEQAYDDARLVGINLIAVMREALGDLSRVKRVVKLLGMVNAVPDFAITRRSSTAAPTCSTRCSERQGVTPVPLSASARCPAISPSRSKRSSP